MAHSHRSLEIHQQPLDVGVHSADSITSVEVFSQPGVDFCSEEYLAFRLVDFQNQESSASLTYTYNMQTRSGAEEDGVQLR